MKAAIFEAFRGPVAIHDSPDPTCPEDGVVVEVRTCGVCRSDWHAWTGSDPDVQLPHVAGHEFAGVVIEVGADCQHYRVGDRVTAPFVLGCGTCESCRAGEATICDAQTTIGFTSAGAFAERLPIAHADFNLVALPPTIDFDVASGLGCRVTTAFRAVVDRGELQPDEWLAVHGCGGVGLSALMIAKAVGARTVAIDVARDKLEMATSLGADITLDAREIESVAEAVRDATGGGAHVSVDALGITETFHQSLRSLRKLGRHIQIGMPVEQHASPTLPLLELVYCRQLALLGTRGLPPQRFSTLLDWIADGRLDIQPLITRRISLSQVGEALAAMDDYQTQVAGITIVEM